MEIQLTDSTFLCTNVSAGDMLRVRSETFNAECWGYAIRLYEHVLEVRLELPDDHPSMVEAARDTGLDYDNVELYDLVPFGQIEFIRSFSGPDRKVRVWKRTITPHERAERARRRGFSRLTLPDLDRGLRCQRPMNPEKAAEVRERRI